MSSPAPTLDRARALAQAGRHAETESACRALLRADPANLDAALLLAGSYRASGRNADAVRLLSPYAAARPDAHAVLGELGAALAAERRFPEAVEVFRRLVALKPRSSAAHLHLGRALLATLHAPAAVAAFETAASINPDSVEIRSELGRALLMQGHAARAIPHLQSALEHRGNPEWMQLTCALANALTLEGRTGEALRLLAALRDKRPGYLPAVTATIEALEEAGRFDDAARTLDDAVAAHALAPELGLAAARIDERRGNLDSAAHAAESTLANPDLAPHYRALLLFALGSIRERQQRPAEAFAAYTEAKSMTARAFDLDAHARLADELVARCSRAAMDRLPRASDRSELPVFIVGMPRSGTSLVEQILACHPSVHGAGELPDIQRLVLELPQALATTTPYPALLDPAQPPSTGALDALASRHLARLRALAPDALRVTDKMPQNFVHLGLIAILFPGARVIHCVRDPLDTCLSCYTTRLGPGHAYSATLDGLAAYYRSYRRLMAHWRSALDLPIHDVTYEQLVAEPEAESRRLVAFLGLPWHDACLRPHQSTRLTRTASREQVRRPVYTSSVGRWRLFRRELEPLRAALADHLEHPATP